MSSQDKPETGFTVLQETHPGSFQPFYWAPEYAEAKQHADCIQKIFPHLNIVIRDNALSDPS